MEGLTGETNGSRVQNRAEKETVNVQTRKKENIGDLIWVKLNEASWWPAQIADENLVSSANKPSSKGLSSNVLARLYGSYIYKYVDVYSSSAEFKRMLIRNNFSYHDILKKSLEQDLPRLSSGKSRKSQQSKSEGRRCFLLVLYTNSRMILILVMCLLWRVGMLQGILQSG